MSAPKALTHAAEVYSPFTRAELARLRRFARKVGELESSTFYRSPGYRMKATPTPGTMLGGQAWNMEVDSPGEEAVKAVVGDFRQLYTDSNVTSATSILKLLSSHAKERSGRYATETIGDLRELRKVLKTRRSEDPYGQILDEDSEGALVARRPDAIIELWLYGEYLHDDDTKADQLGEGGAPTEMLRSTLHNAIRDYIRFWSAVAALASAVLEEPTLSG